MPDDEVISNKSLKTTEKHGNNAVETTEKEKATKITYSLYPAVIRAIEKYSEDNYMSKSQVVTQALRSLIPEEYFE